MKKRIRLGKEVSCEIFDDYTWEMFRGELDNVSPEVVWRLRENIHNINQELVFVNINQPIRSEISDLTGEWDYA